MTLTRPPVEAWAAPGDLDAVYAELLPRVLERAGRSPFYAGRFGANRPASMADFLTVPPTTKQDLRDSYPFGLLAVDRRELATYHESSGTAGQATASYYTENDWEDLVERYARKWVGIDPTDTFLVRTPYALMVTGHLAQASARARGATVVPADNRSLATPISRVVRLMRDLEVSLTWSMPTEALLWVAAARVAGLDPATDFPRLRALFVGGEPVTPARLARISELWGVPVVEEYGSTETGSLAGQCPHGVMHLWADRVLCEVRDPETGTITRTGTGQLVVTPLLREAMPLVRYNLEDVVEVRDEGCPCGWSLPTVRVLGRAAFGYDVAGSLVRQTDLEELVFTLPREYGVMFWRARALDHELLLEIEVADGCSAEAADRLRARVQDRTGAPTRVVTRSPGGLVSHDALRRTADVSKPRSLFGPHEDWDKAHLYF